MIEKLKNCPNCAGILDEAGRCKYCGSKVYDFLTLNFDGYGGSYSGGKTYIRIQTNGKIILLPILHVGGVSLNIEPQWLTAMDMDGMLHSVVSRTDIKMDLELYCGDMVSAEEG